jgi:hypothetical protein
LNVPQPSAEAAAGDGLVLAGVEAAAGAVPLAAGVDVVAEPPAVGTLSPVAGTTTASLESWGDPPHPASASDRVRAAAVLNPTVLWANTRVMIKLLV